MLRSFCAAAGEALSELFASRMAVTLDTIGIESMADALPPEDVSVCAALYDLGGVGNALSILPDGDALFHVVDLLLGGDPEIDQPVPPRTASPLDGRFCTAFTDTVADTLCAVFAESLGVAIARGHPAALVREREALIIVPMDTEVISVRMTVAFGKAGRAGGFVLHMPLAVLDMVSGRGAGKSAPPRGPNAWSGPVKSAVARIELDLLARVQTSRMSLAELSRLSVGSVLPLDEDAIRSVALTIEDGGDVLATGELGTRSGKRAISISAPPDAALIAPVRDLVEGQEQAVSRS